MIIEYKLLSKILDNDDFNICITNNITSQDFTQGKEAYEFIKDYWNTYKKTPSASAVVENCDFEYVSTIDETSFLISNLKNNTAKRKAYDLLQNQASDKFSELKGKEFIDWLSLKIENIKNETEIEVKNGTDYAKNADERWEWYEEAEKNEHLVIPTPYPLLNEALNGGNDLGDYLLLLSYTNQGKSWIATQFGLSAQAAGFGVLHYSPEMSKKQTILRMDTLKGHFSNIHLSSGKLYKREEYRNFLENCKEEKETKYLVKTMEDMENGLSLKVLEADLIKNPDIKFVIIDGFNLMDHKGQDGNRNNMSNTSRALRKLFGKYSVVGLVVHHTPTTSRKEQLAEIEQENGFPTAPKLTDYSETVAVIQDAVTVLTFAQSDGKGVLAVRKARKPCVDFETQLHVNFNIGYITEINLDEKKAGDPNVF